MDSIDLLKSVANKSAGEIQSAESVRSTIRQARRELNELEETVRERHDLDGESDGGSPGPAGIPDELRKPKSEHDRSSRADFYEAAREAGLDPNDAWKDLPE